jgi:hypothetical protein
MDATREAAGTCRVGDAINRLIRLLARQAAREAAKRTGPSCGGN